MQKTNPSHRPRKRAQFMAIAPFYILPPLYHEADSVNKDGKRNAWFCRNVSNA